MDLGLTGKTALITGGTSGIGLAIAQRLARGRMPHRDLRAHAGEARRRARDASRMHSGFIADIGKPADVATLVERTIEAFGRIDIVVSNAGTHISGRIDDVASDVRAAAFPDQGARSLGARALRRAAHAPAGRRALHRDHRPDRESAAGERASLDGGQRRAACLREVAVGRARARRILVNAVCPSRIKSPLTDGLKLYNEIYLGRSLEQQETGWGAEVPLGRWGTPDDIANAVAFLASERAGFICGANIDVDGGHQRMIF